MKLLFVQPFMRVPPDFGLGIRDYHLLSYLAANHSVILMTYETPGQGAFAQWAQQRMSDFISLGPYPSVPKRSEKWSAVQRLFEIVPSALARVRPADLARQVQAAVEANSDLDIIVFDTHLTAQAALYMPIVSVPRVAVLLDIFTNYARRQFDQTNWRPYKLIFGLDWLRMFVYEKRILSCFRYAIAMSEGDAAWARHYAPGAQVFVSPNGVDTEYFSPKGNGQGNQQLLFVGNFGYTPNEDAFFYCVNDILPRVLAECPQASFTAVGLNPTRAMLDAVKKNQSVRVVGNVPDVRPYYAQSDLALIPLRFGSGVKLKILEAMSMGIPVVSTSVGAEGIDVENHKHLLIADAPEAFAKSVVGLLRSKAEKRRLTQNAITLVARYSWDNIAREFEQMLQSIAFSSVHPSG